jgi:hypothetical protein
MKRFSRNIVGEIDYCSYFVIHGWLYDETARGFPAGLSIVDPARNGNPINPVQLYRRPDVASVIGDTADIELGFTVNLFDHFNTRPADYGIELNRELLWSFSSSFEQSRVAFPNAKPPNESGSRLVFLICDPGDPLDQGIRRLVQWQCNFFLKRFNSGVSYKWVLIDQLAKASESVDFVNQQILLVTMSRYLQRVFSANPELVRVDRLLLIDDFYDPSQPTSGLLNTICHLMGIKSGDPLSDFFILQVCSAISGYSDLFFPPDNTLFTFKSGNTSKCVEEYFRREIQGKNTSDVVVISKSPLVSLDNVDNDCCLFVNLGSLRYVIDLMSENATEFLKRATGRGLRVHYRLLES